MRKWLLLIIAAVCNAVVVHADEVSLYDETTIVDGSHYVDIAKDKLQDAGRGDVVRVYVSSISSASKSATAMFQTGNGEALFPEEASFKIYGDYTLILSDVCLSVLKSQGLRISGTGYTIESVTIEKDPRNKLLFEGSLYIDNYSPTLSIPKFQFYNLRVGDAIKVSVADVTSESRGCLQQYEWGEIKSGYSGFEMTGDYSMTVDETVLKWLQEGVLRVRGKKHTVKRVQLYCPSSGYDADDTPKRKVSMLFGLNESGGEFAGVYPGIDQTHYGYPNRQDLQYAARKGFRIIRLPFRWERIQRPVGSATLIASEIKKIKEVLSWAEEFNLMVIFDMHNFGRYCTYCNGHSSTDNIYKVIGENDVSVAQFCDVWRMLAREFKDYEQIWAYEIMNEPYQMLASTPWKQIAQECIYAIREVDMATPILVDGDSFASASRWVSVSDNLRGLNDPADNLIYTAHSYFDKDSSGNYSETYDQSGANEQTGVVRMKPFVEWCKKYGKRGFIGEYGIPDNDTRWLKVLDNALQYLKSNNIGGTYWSAGHRWGDYALSAHPTNNYSTDRPQMSILEKYIYTDETATDVQPPVIKEPHRDGRIYNLYGQLVDENYHGIVICNGRKYYQK